MKQHAAVAVVFICILQEVLSQCGGIGNCNSCKFLSHNFQCTQCNSGYLLVSSTSCQLCSSTCSSCDGYSDCASCKSGYHGYRCSLSCKGCNEDECNKVSGACINGCEDGFYQYSYGPCYACSENCAKCTNKSICTECVDGFYGDQCNTSCSGCVEGKCDIYSGSCQILGCKIGYYKENSSGHCLPCKTNCTACTAFDTCTDCADGFYLTKQFECTQCSDHCINGTICNKTNGNCEAGCDDMWSGEQCIASCSPGCQQCSQYNTSSCVLCQNGQFGGSCEENCSSGCIFGNIGPICNKRNGSCTFGCINGTWGASCENSCSSGCPDRLCIISTGYCLDSCRFNYFGERCDELCNDNCHREENISTVRLCYEENGHCINGCRPGWFGKTCEVGCSKYCKDVECFRSNGSCIYGCLDGYSGSRCNQGVQALRSDQKGSNAAAIGGGVSGCIAVLVAIGILIFVIVYRRRKTSSDAKDHGFAENKYKQADLGHELYNINEACTVKEENDIPRAKTVTCATAPVHTEEFDIIQDDEETIFGQAENTYSNAGGRRVAVETLAEYIKHKSQEELFKEFNQLPEGLLNTYNQAKRPQNAMKNKYRAIYPYDENRVVLASDGGDYMNASYIDGYNRSGEYIASSGPFQRSYDTTPDFWRMVFQERCEIIIMLTNLFEEGQPKCTKYWPDADESCEYGEINIACLTEDVYADFTIRILAVTKGEDSFNIRHVHFTAWPDKGIPHDVTSMIEFQQKVRSLHKDKESPMLVHCSAGIGRTGTFIVLDMLTYEGGYRGSVDIYGSVASLRYQRCNMVQTKEQYVYIHHAVLHSLTFDCRSVPGDIFLQNFNKLIERNGGESIIDRQFQQLQSILDEVTDEDRSQIERNTALSKSNRNDADIPADEYRVKLHENRTTGFSDYINAVFINSFRKKRKFICAQTPLPTTVVDFLSLILQERCTCVVSMEEPGIQDKTVKVYWPADNQVVKHGTFKVSCKESTTMNHFMTKKLSITFQGLKGEESRDVNLYNLTNWPKDSPVPKTSDSLLELVKTVDAVNRTSEDEPPILIHCRTGAERSCLYCAVSVLIEKMEIEHEVSVVNTLRQIKARRLSAISSVEQYKFCHQAVIRYLQSFDIYSNFSLKEKAVEA